MTAASRSQMNLALFDFDGTITTTDTFTSFLHFAVRPVRVAIGTALLAPMLLGYRCRMIPACRARRIVARVGFQGERVEYVRERGRQYAAEVLPNALRPEAVKRIAWHKRQGDLVVVASASLDVYLDPWCGAAGVRRISTELEERNGRLTGRYRQGDCSGRAKVQRILAEYDVTRFPIIYAYGDTLEDREMLELAHRRYYRWQEIHEWREAALQGACHPKAKRHS
jgi:phosphatidylglycerophosphatase C